MRIKNFLLLFILAGCLGFTTSLAAAAETYIDITRFSSKKIPMAISLFRTAPAGVRNVSVDASNRLSDHLDFTGYFKILDRSTFLIDANNLPGDAATINFPNWTTVGAEMLITGDAKIKGSLLEIDLRLFDTFKGELRLGKRYKGWMKDLPRIIRRFASEVIHDLTGEWGIFDSKLAFVSNGSGHKEVFVCDFDGKNIRPFTQHSSISLSPAWSSDGQWIAYTSFAKGKPDLYIRGFRGGVGAVVAKKGINTSPAWMPGQSKLAATLSFSGDQEIYLLTGNGKIIKRLTRKWGIDTSPTFSPDGQQIAFVSSRSGSPQIHVTSINGGGVQRLTFHGKYNTQPSWSPRGDKIAYSAVERGEINIHVVDVGSKQSARLTYGAGRNESPTWSPDGSLIAFSSSRDGAYRIYVMTANGADQRRLVQMPGEQTMPRWSPRLSNQ